MELAQEGQEAHVGGIKNFVVSLRWTSAVDFDLAAAYKAKDGRKGLCYFGDLGSLDDFPNMQLSGDDVIGGTGDDNEETMRVMGLDAMEFVWFLCWDYGGVQDGTAIRLKDSEVTCALMDGSGTAYEVKLDTSDMGNVCCVATIDNSSPMGAKFVNTSKVGTLKGLNNLSELMGIINS